MIVSVEDVKAKNFGTIGLIRQKGMQEKHKRLAKVAKDISKAKGTKISLQNMFLVFLCQLGVKDVMISIF